MRTFTVILCATAIVLGGCLGFQGGNEGEEDPCAHDTERLHDLDAVPHAFEQTPREIFEAATQPYGGTLGGPNVKLSLEFRPNYELLRASYPRNDHSAGCGGPQLELPATAWLSAGGGETTTTNAILLFRAGNLEAVATFIAASNTPLASVAPPFSSPPTESPTLGVHLQHFADDTVHSDWHWTALVCSTMAACAGSPEPGKPAANGTNEYVHWGSAELTR